MKISKSLALLTCLNLMLFSCKKEINEKETLSSIKKSVKESFFLILKIKFYPLC